MFGLRLLSFFSSIPSFDCILAFGNHFGVLAPFSASLDLSLLQYLSIFQFLSLNFSLTNGMHASFFCSTFTTRKSFLSVFSKTFFLNFLYEKSSTLGHLLTIH